MFPSIDNETGLIHASLHQTTTTIGKYCTQIRVPIAYVRRWCNHPVNMTWFEFSGDNIVDFTGAPDMPFEIHSQTSNDINDIKTLVSSAFGPDREKRTVYQFRDGINQIDNLCFVAHAAGKLVGSIQFWPATLPNGKTIPLLGPLAVKPELRGKGVGRALIQTGLLAAKDKGFKATLIVGDPGYYAPFGFSVDTVQGLILPGAVNPLVFMGINFQDNYLENLSGTVTKSCID